MRLMLKFTIPVERGNAAASDGTIAKAIEELVADVKAEAAYFMLLDGKRAGLVFFEETDQARLPWINEKLFGRLDVEVEIMPALTLDDLKRGLSG